MARCAVLPFRVGHLATEPVSDHFKEFYRKVASFFVDGPVELSPQLLTTIPVSLDEDVVGTLELVRERLANPQVALVIIDLANSMRSLLPPYKVISAIAAACSQSVGAQSARPQYLFLMTAQLRNADPAMEPILALRNAGHAAILSDDGSLVGNVSKTSGFSADAYGAALGHARTAPLELLKLKLIRQHGHFHRFKDGVHDHCVQYYFDGRNCTTELTKLLTEIVSRRRRESSEILVHAPESPWFQDAAQAVAFRLEMPLRSLSLESEGLRFDGDMSDDPLVLVPMCDTGQTCDRIIRGLRSINPRVRPIIVAALSTQGPTPEGGKRIRYVDEIAHEVEYFLHVSQPHHPIGLCRQCRVSVPNSDPVYSSQDGLSISTFGMWSMLIEAGLKVEDDKPEGRPSLGLIPDFPAVVGANGPYLAAKMHSVLEKLQGGLPRNPVVICPDEAGARTLSQALMNMYRYTVVRIPRKALQKGYDRLREKDRKKGWYIQLVSLRGNPALTSVIVLDEFSASSGTRTALRDMAKAFGLDVRCYLSLFDFNPETKSMTDAPVHSLYSINWLGVGGRAPNAAS